MTDTTPPPDQAERDQLPPVIRQVLQLRQALDAEPGDWGDDPPGGPVLPYVIYSGTGDDTRVQIGWDYAP